MLILDDYQANAIANLPDPQWSRNRTAAVAAMQDGRSVLVSDISYCRPDVHARLLELMRQDVPGVDIESMYFENDSVPLHLMCGTAVGCKPIENLHLSVS